MTKKIAAAFRSLTGHRFFPALPAALAIAVGMLLPSAVLSVQSAYLEKSDTLISTGVSAGRQSSETAKLDIISRFHSAFINGSGEELPLSRGRFMTAEQAEGLLPEFESILNSAGLEYTAPPDYAEKTVEPFLMLLDDGSGIQSAIFWIVHFYWDKNELCFFVDDETGIIISGYRYDYDGSIAAAEPPEDAAQLAAAQRLAEALCRSYGFENVTAEAEAGSLGDETGLPIAENYYDAEYFAEYNIRFALNGETKCRMSLSFEGQNWHFGV